MLRLCAVVLPLRMLLRQVTMKASRQERKIARVRRRTARRLARLHWHNDKIIARGGGIEKLSGQERIDLALGRWL